MNPLSIFTSPEAIALLLHSAAVAVEKASPDYTIAHHVAATVDRVLGNQPVSTPTAQSSSVAGGIFAGLGTLFGGK